ncbi:Crp/Fnr family transcriptional regulator [Novosphingobium sp. G106]|uniref:Crp/Fnr family transcriptional regulator n=1 Tax=Novosphingobium sp. G106 TaxID=2849500 RepID=UPI001C2CD2B4|nr:Crp/Fnr family transcriptional regulator [Novosphingobium sp. G106]MBV1688667.1 Crp/Fnr family transcriptional regulator [Novosphingobium sp. G106]
MIEKLLLRLRARHDLSPEEEIALRETLVGPEDIPAQKTVVRRGERLNRSILLLDGLMCRYKDLRNGRRQITALHIPGDFLDLHGYTLKYLDHDLMAIAPSRVAYAPHDRIDRITEQFPRLTRLFWFSTNLDAAMHREWELSLGQRLGSQRAAHLLCELHVRFDMVGMTQDKAFDLPMNQSEFGECLGLTVVHTNRVLRELRQRGLAEFAKGHVRILDLAGLRAFAEFDPGYLYLEKTII